MLSNTLAALSVAFVIPYAVEGILKMRFTLPRWIAVMYHLSATSIAIMMVFVLVFMSWASPEDAFGGSNLVTHVFCPLLILIAFFQTENGQIYTLLDKLLGIVPFCVYLVVYLVEVVVVGEANNGWPDIYHITEYLSPALAIPIMLLFAFGISTIVASISNYLTRRRMAKTFRYWSEDVEPYEVRIEAYGLGRVAGLYGERNNIQVPLDILEHLAERYQLKTEDLMKPFFKGIQVGVKERESQSLAAALDLQKPGQQS